MQESFEEGDGGFVTYGGHITLAEIYEFLWEHSEDLIFFDDVSQVINKTEIMELLKQALNIHDNDRYLNYRSKGVLNDQVPNRFKFKGRIIMAFNTMDKNNPNVKAILDRAPVIELKFSRKEIFDAMYKIAEGNTGGLLEHEKLIVTKEIENYTDNTMDISLRKQYLAFQIYQSCKQLYGDANTEWKTQVHRLFGKKKETWMRNFIRELVGDKPIKQKDLAKEIALRRNMSLRNAYREIRDFLEMEEIYANKKRQGEIALKPF
jgi:hypothetical protein